MKNGRHCHVSVFWALLAATLTPLAATASDEVSSYAFVQEDGSLKISGDIYRLYGVYIPPTGQTRYDFTRPVQCGSRAALALDFKIGAEFVNCKSKGQNADGTSIGYCTARGEALSAFMLQRGWAVALPAAPFEYAAMEKIARSKTVIGVRVNWLSKAYNTHPQTTLSDKSSGSAFSRCGSLS